MTGERGERPRLYRGAAATLASRTGYAVFSRSACAGSAVEARAQV